MIRRLLSVAVLALLSLPAHAGEIEIVSPVLRLPAISGGNGAVFLTIVNHGPADRLTAASLPNTRATELHTHQRDGAVVRMRRVESIEVPANGRAELRPGGDHIMAIGLDPAPAAGEEVTLTLTFAQAGTIETKVTASPAVPQEHRHGGN
ncbi:copper chaperone PCu(A)C [Phaeospirillum tilakii]|uniref:Copper chaperone PCu(A)C n=1 Tax=Phaeospirillum tilakii TaxID=741673 RepID=A0ABW5C6S1_9PROT